MEQREKLVEEVSALLGAEPSRDRLCYEYDKPDKPPQIDVDQIRFNGKLADGHETFLLLLSEDENFAFCKTARKPYDAEVKAVLDLVEKHCPGWLRINSDGPNPIVDDVDE